LPATIATPSPGSFTGIAWLPAWRVALASCVLAVAACGGGGGDDNAAEPPPAPPPAPGALLAPPAQTLQIDQRTTPTALAGQFEVRFSGSTAPAWTAQSDQAWLRLAPATGTGAGTLAYTVDAAQLQSQPNWSTAVATVRISAAGLGDVSTTLTLDKRLSEITMVWPTAVAALQPATVRVRGRGLSQLSDTNAIQVEGASTGVTLTIVSDTEATVRLPAMALGAHAISVGNGLGATSPQATLVAADPAALVATPPNFGSYTRTVLFDAARNALLNTAGQQLLRSRVDAGQWVSDAVELPNQTSVRSAVWLAMAPDGQSVYALVDQTLLAIDPQTLAIQASYAVPADWDLVFRRTLTTLPQVLTGALTQDLRLWFTARTMATQGSSTTETLHLAYFDLRSKRFESAQLGGGIAITSDMVIGASGDGSRLVGVRTGASSGHFVYDAATGQFHPLTGLPDAPALTQVSGDGKSMLLGTRLVALSDQYAATAKGSTSKPGSFSANGSRIYGVDETNVNTVIREVLVWDATTDATGSSALPLLGRITLPEAVSPCAPIAISVAGCYNGALVVSPLGNALLWPAFRRLLVLPIPAELR
jgi:hypothetical protein